MSAGRWLLESTKLLTASRIERFVLPVTLTGLISKVPEKFSEQPGGVCAVTEAARARRATVYFMVFWNVLRGGGKGKQEHNKIN